MRNNHSPFMQQKNILSTLLFLLFTASLFSGYSQDKITIDEDFSDWNSVVATYTDGVDNPGGIDLLEMQVANDEEYLFVKFSIDREVALGNTLVSHTLWLGIDADNDPSTGFPEQAGYGTELAVNFNGHYAWFNIPNPSIQVNFGNIGIHMAPTVTASTFEVAIPKDIRPDGINKLFSGDSIRLVINEDQGNDRMPNPGTVFSYVFTNTPGDTIPPVDLSKDDPSYIRAVSYNILRDDAWEPAGLPSLERIVKALDADLFCFQESNQTSEQFAKSNFDGWLPLNNGFGWYVYKDGGGRLTCSRWPIGSTWDLWRKNAMRIDLPNSYPTDLLLINGHLSCCTANSNRQGQVDEFVSFVLDAKSPGGIINVPDSTPIIFLGDMNFVGFNQQLKTTLTGAIQDEISYGQGGPLDWDGTDLTDARPLHLDSNLVFTWRDLQGNGFPPGRLDFQFYTDAVMKQMKSFVLEVETMSPQMQAQYNLQNGDTRVADHLPLVVDYALGQTPTSVERKQSEVDIRIYPNPARDFVVVDTEEPIEYLTLRDLSGRKIGSSTEGENEISLSGISPGTYLLEVKLKEFPRSLTRPIVVK